MVYTISGSHLYSIDLNLFCSSVLVLDNKTVLVTSAYQSKGYKFNIVDLAKKEIVGGFVDTTDEELTWRHLQGEKNFYKNGKEILFHEMMNNSIGVITKEMCATKYQLKFSNEAPNSFWQSKYQNVMDISMTAIQNGYTFGVPYFLETRNSMLFTYHAGMSYLMCYHDKKLKESIQFSKISFDEISEPLDIISLGLDFNSKESCIITIPEYVQIEGINNNGNPVLCFIEPK